MKKQKEKVGIYIDGANIFYGLREKRMDFMEFRDWLIDGRLATSLHYFNNNIKEKISPFFVALENMGYSVHVKQISQNKVTKRLRQKGVDVGLAVRAVLDAQVDIYDTLILVSGDYDFQPVIEYVLSKGKNVEIISFKECLHPYYNQFKCKSVDDFLKSPNALLEG